MNGEFSLYKAKEGRLKDYDIIFIGMSRPELEGVCASRIRKEIGENSKTKLVICIDYAIELWQQTFQPYMLEQELMQADIIFVSEPSMLSNVKTLINDKKEVYHIPHPTDIEQIKKYRVPLELKSNEIVTLIHRYDNNWMQPFITTKDLSWNTHAILLDQGIMPHLFAFFKYMHPGYEFMQYIEWVSRKRVMLDSYHKIHTYGRSAIDCACLGLPVVGSNWQWAQNYLWPDLTVEAGDIHKQKELIIKLMEDDDFYKKCIEKADSKLSFFNYENRRNDLLNVIYR